MEGSCIETIKILKRFHLARVGCINVMRGRLMATPKGGRKGRGPGESAGNKMQRTTLNNLPELKDGFLTGVMKM